MLIPTEDVINITNKSGIDIIYAEKDIYYIDPEKVPDHCGVYIITTKSGKRYIGSSVNLRRRAMSCIKNIGRDDVASLGAYLTENEKDARILERWFLFSSKPELNTHKPASLGRMRTVQIPDDVHLLIGKKRIEIIQKYGVYLTISEIVEFCIQFAIDIVRDEEWIDGRHESDPNVYNKNIEIGI